MDPATEAALLALNARFYAEAASDFSATRAHPWSGWRRLPITGVQSVLDVGAGNGRFGRYLRSVERYVALDASRELLAEAERLGTPGERICADARVDPLPTGFDLAVAFGLLHHVPTARGRLALARKIARSGRAVALSLWAFEKDAELMRRSVDPLEAGIEGLEPGDHILRFGPRGLRYCHAFDEAEIDAIASAIGATERFEADRANVYVVRG